MSKCSDTLKWQVMTMEKLNMMVIGEMCKFDMKVKNQVEKAREMYAALIEFMTNGKLYLYSCVSVGGGVCVFCIIFNNIAETWCQFVLSMEETGESNRSIASN